MKKYDLILEDKFQFHKTVNGMIRFREFDKNKFIFVKNILKLTKDTANPDFDENSVLTLL